MKKTNHTKTTLRLLAATVTWICCTVGQAEAGIFDDPLNELTDPAIATSQTAHDSNYLANNVFDGVLSPGSGNQYATGSPTNIAADAFIDFDFATATTIGGFVFYQRDAAPDQVTDFNLIFSNNADFSAPVATLNFATTGTPDFALVADPTGTPTRQEFEFASPLSARYVRWEVNASQGIYDGAAEMEFWAVAGPDTTPPTIFSLSPTDGAPEAAIGVELVATFAEPVQAGTTGNIRLKRASDGFTIETFDVTSSLQLTFGGSSVTIDPTSDLVSGVEYYVLIDAGAIVDTSANANPFAGISTPPDASKWSFTADATAPTSSSMGPMAGETDVPLDAALTITFGEDVQLGIGTITIHLVSDDSEVQTIDVTGGAVTISGAEVTIDISELASGTAYYVNIASGAFEDLSGNVYVGITDTTTWAFTTVPPFGPLTVSQDNGNLVFEWSSREEKVYNLLSSTALSGGSITWSAYSDGSTTHANIPNSGTGTNTLTVPMPADPRRFFAVSEYPAEIDAETLAAWSAPYRNWHYQPDHVIPGSPNIPGYEGVSLTDVPTVFQIPGDPKWYMTFVGFDGGGYQSFIAESTDLVNWTNRRLAMPYGPAGAFDYGGVVLGAYLYESYDIKAPRTLKLKDGKFWSLYAAYDQRTGYEAGVGSNGLASSIDGVNWSRTQNDPVVSIYDDDAGAWESNVIYMPWLIEHEGTYYNHYNAKGGPEQIGAVTSGDLLTWTRYENNPVIPVGASPYNTAFSADPKIFWDRDHWVCFFFGVGGGAHIMAAFSRDLYDWTVDPNPLYLAGGNPSGLDSTYAHKISLVWNPANETYYLYYCAVGNQGRGIGLITSKPLDD